MTSTNEKKFLRIVKEGVNDSNVDNDHHDESTMADAEGYFIVTEMTKKFTSINKDSHCDVTDDDRA